MIYTPESEFTPNLGLDPLQAIYLSKSRQTIAKWITYSYKIKHIREDHEMSVSKMIENEIKTEQRILNNYRKRTLYTDEYLLLKESKGRRRFYIKKKGSSRLIYINSMGIKTAEELLKNKVHCKTISILEKNISVLKNILPKIKDYDLEAVLDEMPPAYKKLKENLERKGETQIAFPQSENTKDRAGLKYRTSFGLFVRSKNEVLIAEALYAAGLEFWYEKRLELVVKSGDGYNTDVEYPDFTIRLPDGSIVYWEHFGMMDKKDYQ